MVEATKCKYNNTTCAAKVKACSFQARGDFRTGYNKHSSKESRRIIMAILHGKISQCASLKQKCKFKIQCEWCKDKSVMFKSVFMKQASLSNINASRYKVYIPNSINNGDANIGGVQVFDHMQEGVYTGSIFMNVHCANMLTSATVISVQINPFNWHFSLKEESGWTNIYMIEYGCQVYAH